MYKRQLDTALDDIDSRGLSNQNSVLISFTDGRDFSSLNFYPAFRSQAQMQEYIEQRLRNVKQAQDQFYGQQLDTYFVSLGSNVIAKRYKNWRQRVADSTCQHLKTAL